MAIYEDPSTPAVAVVQDSTSASSAVTGSFSPPAGTLLVATLICAYSVSVTTPTLSISDSVSGSWTAGPYEVNGTGGGGVAIWYRYLSSAPGSMTVTGSTTLAGTSSVPIDIVLAVRVAGGAAASQSGAGSQTAYVSSASASFEQSITTTRTGSWVYLGTAGGVFWPVAEASTLIITALLDTVTTDSSIVGRSAFPTGTPGSTSFGWSISPGTSTYLWAGLEILPALTVDTAVLPPAYENVAYAFQLAADGGTGSGYSWTVSTGSLPGWASLSSGGLITGTPPGSAGSQNFTVQVTDSGSVTATCAVTLAWMAPEPSQVSAIPGWAVPGLFTPGMAVLPAAVIPVAAVIQAPPRPAGPAPPPVPAQLVYPGGAAAVPADQAGAAEQLVPAAAVPAADAAGAADSLSPAPAVPVTDTAGAAEQLAWRYGSVAPAVICAVPRPAGPAPPPVPAQVLYAPGTAVYPADTAGAAEAIAVAVTLALADTAGAAEIPAPSAAVTLPLADTAAAADQQAAVILSSQPVLAQAVPLWPAPALAPPAQVITAAVTVSAVTETDAAGAADQIAVAAAVPPAEAAGAADMVLAAVAGNITVVITAPPRPAGPLPPPVPAQVLGPAGVAVAPADVAAGAEAVAPAAAVPLAEAAAAADTPSSIAVAATAAEEGAAADLIAVTITSIAPAILQAPPVPAGPPPPPVPAQLIVTPGTAVSPADTAGAADQAAVSAAAAAADAGGAADQVSVIGAALAQLVITGPPRPAGPAPPPVPAQLVYPGGAAVTQADTAGAADVPGVSPAVPLAEAAAAADQIAVQVTSSQPALLAVRLPAPAPLAVTPQVLAALAQPPSAVSLADTAAAAEQLAAAAAAAAADAGGAAEQAAAAAAAAVPDTAGAADAQAAAAAVPYPDQAGASDALQPQPSAPLGDAGGGLDQLQGSAAAALSDGSGAAEVLSVVSAEALTGPAAWTARPAPPRWTAVPAAARWQARPAAARWAAQPAPARWAARPAPPRWRITVQTFAPIAAASVQYINILFESTLAGTEIDPTGQTAGQPQLEVQFAVPVSSGNPLAPAQAVTWYAAEWLTGTNIAGYIAQGLVGPASGGGLVQLTAGMSYDVWGKITGTPEIPEIYAGTQEAY